MKRLLVVFAACAVAALVLLLVLVYPSVTMAPTSFWAHATQFAATAFPEQVKEPRIFADSFESVYALEEAARAAASKNPDWWVSSGAYFYSNGQQGSTIIGSLQEQDPRRAHYGETNPMDTDDGYHPQNIFRLVQKDEWRNFTQQMYFKIKGDHLSASPYRNSSNGVLFFNRYQDEFNLYYTGIRVDGYVTIKKKVDGVYYTLAYDPFIRNGSYDREENPTLLPKDTWIGLRSEVVENDDSTVTIRLYVDMGKTGTWALAAEVMDDGESYGGAVLPEGHTGIRTDFMDIIFDDYVVRETAS